MHRSIKIDDFTATTTRVCAHVSLYCLPRAMWARRLSEGTRSPPYIGNPGRLTRVPCCRNASTGFVAPSPSPACDPSGLVHDVHAFGHVTSIGNQVGLSGSLGARPWHEEGKVA